MHSISVVILQDDNVTFVTCICYKDPHFMGQSPGIEYINKYWVKPAIYKSRQLSSDSGSSMEMIMEQICQYYNQNFAIPSLPDQGKINGNG
jgi:hypothetical protein